MYISEEEADRVGERLIAQALVAYARMPDPGELARIGEGLLAHGAGLSVAAEAVRGVDPRVAGALRDWRRLVADGPAENSLGQWNHVRALARAVRTMRRGLGMGVPETPSERKWLDGGPEPVIGIAPVAVPDPVIGPGTANGIVTAAGVEPSAVKTIDLQPQDAL
ncbi:hypothetical protein, partial [Streptomyces sp. NPDC097619]|uniref:hypothetical protein n=1 Tax=Streptomyces sp. NPDC097619 TaxID=3157228 RepID=UPI003317F007